MMYRSCGSLLLMGIFLGIAAMEVDGQQIGFVEKFALAEDRSKLLQELIPGSEEYYYFHTLHYQNNGLLNEAEAILSQWSKALKNPPTWERMNARQRLLRYDTETEKTLAYLRDKLQLQLDHAPPQADRAKDLPTQLDSKLIETSRIVESALSRDPSLSELTTEGLKELFSRELPVDQLRLLLQRWIRVDHDRILELVERELKTPDSRGWGAFPIHEQLTLDQRRRLMAAIPKLLENDPFVRRYLFALLPSDDESRHSHDVQRKHLQRLEDFVFTLPPSQNSLKATVLFHRLKLDLVDQQIDRNRFEKYLSLPRQQAYYNQETLKSLDRPALVQLQANYAPETGLGPIVNDMKMIRSYLELFFQKDGSVDSFSKWLDRKFLEQVFTETKILYGIGNSADWYSQLTPQQQKQIRDRIEVQFAPQSPTSYRPEDSVVLSVDVKNVSKLIYRVYQINPRNVFRKQGRPVSTDLDLDGLVANFERTLEFSLPADRRHRVDIPLPQCEGRGTWIIDLLGGGLRSRALIIKGSLRCTQEQTDAGQEFRIFDESGAPSPTAKIEFGSRTYSPNEEGAIFIPYGETDTTQSILLVDGLSATPETIQHRRESYQLEAGFLLDSQNLISGAKGTVIVRPQLRCNGRPMPMGLLEDVQLQIVTTDQDGIQSTQTVTALQLADDREVVHSFLVPQRLKGIVFTLRGSVLIASRNVKESVSDSLSIDVNGMASTAQIQDFFLIMDRDGYRVRVLGRNGEPVARLPVQLQLQHESVTRPIDMTLATDARGECLLGALNKISNIRFSAEGIAPRAFSLRRVLMEWPRRIHVRPEESIHLPWLHEESKGSVSDWTLLEVRNRHVVADRTKLGSIKGGELIVSPLNPGTYFLTDHRSGGVVEIRSIAGQDRGRFIVGPTHSALANEFLPTSLAEVVQEKDKIRFRVVRADRFTRLHVVSTSFVPDREVSDRMRLATPETYFQSFELPISHYVDSLRLDEEYQYILQRQYATKYPGNLLSQPSLLLQPWELATTANTKQEAAAGDVPPPSAVMPKMMAESKSQAADPQAAVQPVGGSVYEFLGKSGMILSNLVPDGQGWVEIPLEKLQGYQSVAIVVVHPSGMVAKQIGLPSTDIPRADLRLSKSFDLDRPLALRRWTKRLKGGTKSEVGDARSTRIQVYSSLADIFRLYGTLLPNSELEKFRKIIAWNKFAEEEKEAIYSELACHELNLFLYRKDRPFFDRVVRPFLEDKVESQLVDDWLLGKSLDRYRTSWQKGRLNSLEKILLMEKDESDREGILKWLRDSTDVRKVPPEIRTSRFLAALAGSSLDLNRKDSYLAFDFQDRDQNALGGMSDNLFGSRLGIGQGSGAMGMGGMGAGGMGMGGMQGGMPGAPGAKPMDEVEFLSRKMIDEAGGEAGRGGEYRKMARRSAGVPMLYQSLDQTREWAETQYHRVSLANQGAELVPPKAFWLDLATRRADEPFVSEELHMPTNTLNEALLALAHLDLPLDADPAEVSIEEGKIYVQTKQPAVAFMESIEAAKEKSSGESLLVGQEIYFAFSGSDRDSQKPVTQEALLKGVAYRASIVVTNPSGTPKTLSILHQIPQGAIPLQSGKFVRSEELRLEQYSTQQVQSTFYFPESGEFDHYGPQATIEDAAIASAAGSKRRVIDRPDTIDVDTWSHVASWGTNEQVLEYLKSKNVQPLDLARIAFRMRDRAFFDACLSILDAQQIYVPALWSYAVFHKDRQRIGELLSQSEGMSDLVGPVLHSPIFRFDSSERYDYQHLDYRPLVLARSHQLGANRILLNARMHAQYHRLLARIAAQASLSEGDRLSMTYYLLLQNRIEEALALFERVREEPWTTSIQYAYMSAYLNFYRGKYDEAALIAKRYKTYPVPRWRDLFGQVELQVRQRDAMLAGKIPPTTNEVNSDLTDPIQRMLIDARQSQQTSLASEAPALDLKVADGVLLVTHQNIREIELRYYLMDIELLFSRSPFVQHEGSAMVAIQPNVIERKGMDGQRGKKEIRLPKELENRNVLVEVISEGITRSQVVYANAMDVTLVDAYGRLQVTTVEGRPVEQAYVKVYAKHKDGQVRFYKDGYTDLRGQFDYASLSNGDLETVQKFAILILHERQGAMIREADPPKR